ncbi:hypothetical protein [Dactylosporangium salmoneum]|uniref:hypothetical protein n=1 Tax=Dactylosporangium salmoneum TaxID=53361 RepID=UPI0031CED228
MPPDIPLTMLVVLPVRLILTSSRAPISRCGCRPPTATKRAPGRDDVEYRDTNTGPGRRPVVDEAAGE